MNSRVLTIRLIAISVLYVLTKKHSKGNRNAFCATMNKLYICMTIF